MDGQLMKERGTRDKIVIATKVVMEMGPNKKGLKKDYIFSSVDSSLKRLQTDRIDLYISQNEDDDTSPAYQSIQPMYNLYDRGDFEHNLQSLCEEYGLGVTPYYALASGFLTGKYRNESDTKDKARGARVKQYVNTRQ